MAEQFSTHERAGFADRLMEGLTHDIPLEISAAQVTEVQRRIAELESSEVEFISGDEALAHVRQLVASASSAS